MPKEKPSLIVKNKNASRNYKLDESFQAGIVLEGWEVKSLRQSKVDVKNSYVNIKKGEAWLIGVKIDCPPSLQQESIDTTKSRKLLLHKKEISKIERLKGEKGLTCVLTRIYWKDNLSNCDIAMGKGKKHRDQREDKEPSPHDDQDNELEELEKMFQQHYDEIISHNSYIMNQDNEPTIVESKPEPKPIIKRTFKVKKIFMIEKVQAV